MFVGRKEELKKLNELYKKESFECVVIYGRRRVGKTTLINEFIKDKESIYYTGLETTEKENLENFSNSIFNYSMGSNENSPVFESFQKALDYLHDISKEKRIVLVIDEYPYLANSYKGISSMLQIQIDKKFKNSKLFIILCGSSVSFMENQVLGYKSPLYGRRTAQFKIEPFNFFETKEYYKNFSILDLAMVYGITGGIPQYLEKVSDKKSIEDNIKDNFLDISSYLFEEPSNLIKQELREPSQYNAIIKAIASGSSKLNEIATKTGMTTSTCSNYIASLISLGLIKKEFPIRDEKTKKTIYRLKDNMFRFWYRFIPENIARINKGMKETVYKSIQKQLSNYMGEVFEAICEQYMWKENIAGNLPVEFINIGRWWGNNPKQKREEEIDLLAFDDENKAIFCECKWRNESVDKDVLEALIEKSKLFSYKDNYYYLFSKSGFTDECIESAKDNKQIKLIDFEEMNL